MKKTYVIEIEDKHGIEINQKDIESLIENGSINNLKIVSMNELASSPSPLTVIEASEVRAGRPAYMNREDAINTMQNAFFSDIDSPELLDIQKQNNKEQFGWMIDALIESGHLTNHLPYGEQKNVSPLTDEEIERHESSAEEKVDRLTPVKPSESKIDRDGAIHEAIQIIDKVLSEKYQANYIMGMASNIAEPVIDALIERGFIPTSEDKKEPMSNCKECGGFGDIWRGDNAKNLEAKDCPSCKGTGTQCYISPLPSPNVPVVDRDKLIRIISELFAKCNNTIGHPLISEIIDALLSSGTFREKK